MTKDEAIKVFKKMIRKNGCVGYAVLIPNEIEAISLAISELDKPTLDHTELLTETK